ncbi:hypothetical protein DAPPUDRAFT_318379 [Daphnia pulex]|uniref:Uncharacterized protein n=1 Tax=Daphnia pulex TaxID=6669 RepID=E9GIM0_DAPPU|nr:hypothetical protein DAPPUDRAFT_318379 [Daphnia pulex]|eukprot:EFX80681.1 hypothetical protein DAPPUDRAFT_318379 [Daphnia pulex]
MNSSEAEEAWQQEKEFLDYMFVSLRHGDESGAAAAASESARIRRTGQQQQQQQPSSSSSISYTTNSTSSTANSTAANNTDVISSTKSLTSVKTTDTPAGLDHLDNLCKLMEQLGELRDANSRLQKRVHYLEDMKTLQEMHQELDLFVGSDSAASASNMSTKADAGADRSLDSLDSGEILPIISQHQAELIPVEPANKSAGIMDNNSNGSVEHSSSGGGGGGGGHRQSRAGKKIKSHHHMKFKKPGGTLLKYRERSKSVGFDENVAPPPIAAGGEENEVDYDVNNASATTTPSPDSYKLPETAPVSRSRPKTKVSKWTRVKEAFRWEKAHVDQQHQATSSGGSPSAGKVTSSSSTSKLPDKEEVGALDSSHNNRHQVSPYQHSLASESSSHAMARSPSPIFRLGRRRRSTTSRTSTSSSSLSECPLESEILKSFADAQELPHGGLCDLGTASRENSPGGKKNHDIEASIKNHPGLLLNSISPEFRKKVEVWERLKSGLSVAPAFDSGALALATPPTPTTLQQHGSSKKSAADSPDWNDIGKRRSEPDKLPPAFKKKLAEWEIRKAVAGKSDQNVEELHKILPHDFNRKLQEWERMKQQQAAAGKMSAGTNQPGLERQGSGKQHHHNRGGKHVKTGQKTDEVQQHRGEKQKEKELQWLEKELQKIEREKLRLEREREKYIERESRLEKIREAMKQPGHGPQREICIRTSTGEFRFQGLSRKFTKKLFQWEEQKGIRPEASTIALLDGAFSPGHHHHLHHHHPAVGEFSSSISARPSNLSAISRSKSESSIADLVSASVHSQPSSLSLNDAETTADFDRRLASDQEEGAQSTPGPGALLVEVEDVTEDCAAVVDIPEVEPQAPIYSIAPAELRQTIHRSEQEEQPRFQVGITGPARVERNDSVRTEASFKLLEENLSLLDRLRAKGEIVKYLELQMTSIDGDMAGVANTQTEEMVRLKEEETCLSDQEDNNSTAGNSSTIDRLKRRIVLLESRGQQLKSEKEHLQTVYQRQCSQQVHLVQHLVDKMQQLRGIGTSSGDTTPPFDPEALQRLDTLTTEILQEAQTLENSMRHPQRLPAATGNQGELVRQPSSAVRFPEQLSIKANQLKEEYERLRSFDSDLETNSDEEPELTPTPRVILHQLPPVPSEMSSAARKKVFVETHRLVFAPLESSDDKASTTFYQPVAAEEGAEDGVPWRRTPRDQPADSWRRNSSTSTPTEENPPDQSRPTAVTTVRNTAPNIRRMIDKYHQRVTASGKERSAPTFQFRPRCDLMTDERSSSSTPPPTIVIEHRGQSSPLAAAADSPLPFEHGGHLHPNCLVQLSKSLSAGAMGPASTETQRAGSSSASSATGWKGSGVLRSQSGLQLPTGQVTPCTRNPSFFRKSPLDPSIDDLLQKYRGRRQVGSVPADLPKSPTTNPERMLKLKQAREAFLTVGPGAIQSVESLCPSEERAQPLVEEESQSSPHGPALIVQDVTFEAQQPQAAGDTGSCRSQEGSVMMAGAWSAGTGSSVPSSPATSRRSSTNENLRSRTSPQQHPAVSRRSWLKQPSKFFFPKAPKTP